MLGPGSPKGDVNSEAGLVLLLTRIEVLHAIVMVGQGRLQLLTAALLLLAKPRDVLKISVVVIGIFFFSFPDLRPAALLAWCVHHLPNPVPIDRDVHHHLSLSYGVQLHQRVSPRLIDRGRHQQQTVLIYVLNSLNYMILVKYSVIR